MPAFENFCFQFLYLVNFQDLLNTVDPPICGPSICGCNSYANNTFFRHKFKCYKKSAWSFFVPNMTRRKNQFVNLAARVKLAVVFDEIDWARPVLDSIMAKTCDKTTVPKIVKSFRLPGKIFQKKCENKSLRKINRFDV